MDEVIAEAFELPAYWKKNVSGATLTTIKIGGEIRYLARVKSEEDVLESIAVAEAHNLPVKILGAGSNVIIGDQGWPGLILISQFDQIEVLGDVQNGEVMAGSGVFLPKLINFCIENGWSGLENFARIPCQVGGATVNNIHGKDGVLWSEYLIKVEGINLKTRQLFSMQTGECDFAYDQSIFQGSDLFITNVVLKVPNMGITFKEQIRERYDAFLKQKSAIQPVQSNAGCTFKNQEKPAGWYIDQVGMKGFQIGEIAVFEGHANFLINLGGGTAKDYLEMVKTIQKKVGDNFGVQLVPEVEIWEEQNA